MLIKTMLNMFMIYVFLHQLSYAMTQYCPSKDAVHCINIERNNTSKWVKVTMKPKNLTMQLCLSSENVLYLERDDIEHDETKPGTLLIWEFQQCENEACLKTKYLGSDPFVLKYKNDQYYTEPSSYLLTMDPYYGETCYLMSKVFQEFY